MATRITRDVTITTSSGYIGHGVEVSVDHERIFVINHVLVRDQMADRARAHGRHRLGRQTGDFRVERFRLECIGRNT